MSFCSTLLKKSCGEQGGDTAICDRGRGRKSTSWQLIRNKGSNGSYKRGAYRGNRDDKNSCKNNKVKNLKGHNSIEANDDVISKTAGQRAIS
jgi:hypothetical protein